MTSFLDSAKDVDFITKTAIERDPNKRRVKPIEASQASILDFDLGESSDDSDFRIEDHPANSDNSDSLSVNSDGQGSDTSLDEDEDSEDSEEDITDNLKPIKVNSNISVSDILKRADRINFDEKNTQLLICSGCLGDQSDGTNELIECDACGITVHEACYGVSDNVSLASTDSLSPTAPWFCEACKAGVLKPVCELCPNSGGIFKETDVGKWVHLVCALYIPGVAFGEVDRLASVTLFEMPYNKWGAKVCSLCPDERFARTGVCVGCDAGMCRTHFHVTCAQREGFLSEAHSEEVDQADPFYAHCKLHSDKTLVKRRKKNYFALQLRSYHKQIQLEKDSELPEHLRILRKLEKQKQHYRSLKNLRQPPWVPTQKMPRLLTTSASACRKLFIKAELMGIDTAALEIQEAQMAALVDIRKKWHIPPAFSVEYIAYYLDRNDRLKFLKSALEKLLEENGILLEDQQTLRQKYDQVLQESNDETNIKTALKEKIQKYHSAILSSCPTKTLPNVDDIGKPPVVKPVQALMVPTVAALKMGVGFPLTNASTGRFLSNMGQAPQDNLILKECGICRQCRDQHLLAKCDTCHLYYHLNCLNPPLSRLPKKSKLYGWQCSECDKSSDSEVEHVKKPRCSRSRYRREIDREEPEEIEDEPEKVFTPKVTIKPIEQEHKTQPNVTIHVKNYSSPTEAVSYINNENEKKYGENENESIVISSRSAKKRRREKHRSRYSPDDIRPSKEHKRKRKKKSLEIENPTPHPRITIKIRPIPLPAGSTSSASNPQCFYVRNEDNYDAPPPLPSSPSLPASSPVKLSVENTPPSSIPRVSIPSVNSTPTSASTTCDICKKEGSKANLVSCDECMKGYHFTCLEPPLKKSPKKRGYSWHCADCDPTDTELN